MRLVKCYGDKCIKDDIKHSKENVKKYSGKNYCNSCYEELMVSVKYREKAYEILTEHYTICTPLMKKHIKMMHDEYGWSYKKIALLVNFILNIKKLSRDPKYGISFYANYYPEMVKYYKDKKKKEQINKGKKNKTRTVIINEDRYGFNRYKASLRVNMEEI